MGQIASDQSVRFSNANTPATQSKTKSEQTRRLFGHSASHLATGAQPSHESKRAGRPRRIDGVEQPASPTTIALSATELEKSYRRGKVAVPVLQGVDFAAEAGKITSIVGQSGSGKSTLLHLLATLDRPDAGEIHYDGERIDTLSRKRRDQFRNESLGMIFQFYHLLPELSMLENVLAPMMIGQGIVGYFRNRNEMKRRATELLDLVGLAHRVNHRPHELSGGEMQRTAIARALINNPKILLADEPTGNLDAESGAGILEILQQLNREQGLTIVMVTHDITIAESADKCVSLVQGKVEVR
jgi:lipoprotein-releasing system ATP-binding protein